MPIFTIGRGNRPIEIFCEILRKLEVEALADLRSPSRLFRSSPYGKQHFPGQLAQVDVAYHYLGEFLGPAQDYPGALDEEGQLNFTRYQRHPRFREGIRRLVRLSRSVDSLILFGSPASALSCHRFSLVVKYLRQAGSEIRPLLFSGHITPDLELRSHEEEEDQLVDFYFRESHLRYQWSREELLAEAYRLHNRDLGWRP